MSSSGYDEMGPRIDLGPVQDEAESGPTTTGKIMEPPPMPKRPKAAIKPPVAPVKRRKSGGSGGGAMLVALLSLIIALGAVGASAYVMYGQPEAAEEPEQNTEVLPGGGLDRVKKLEKDVYGLMLRLISLEKELRNVAGQAGSITKLTELSAKVAALQGRLDRLNLTANVAARAASRPAVQPAKPAVQPAKPVAAKPKPAAPKPAGTRKMYTVRSGDNLFDIALRYKVTVRDLRKWNKLKGNKIVAGKKLVIYTKK